MSSSEKSTTTVALARNADVATISFATEAGLNILSSRVIDELGRHVASLHKDRAVRFVVIRGTGKAFLAGADISEMSQFDEGQGRVFSEKGHRAFDAIETLPQVTFAAINGHAMGGGCELALACDFRIMVSGAKIGQPESRLGLIPGWGGTFRLARLIGPARARRLLYSGEAIRAEEAHEIGLVDELVSTPEALDGALETWFQRCRPGSPAAIDRIKQAVRNRDEIGHFAACFSCAEAREGMRAFLEKRAPAWTS